MVRCMLPSVREAIRYVLSEFKIYLTSLNETQDLVGTLLVGVRLPSPAFVEVAAHIECDVAFFISNFEITHYHANSISHAMLLDTPTWICYYL
jgi:hypothetical protein